MFSRHPHHQTTVTPLISGNMREMRSCRGIEIGEFDNRPISPGPKPELWAAVEGGDVPRVIQLLREGRDPEERYQGWTPLMNSNIVRGASAFACSPMS